MASFLTKKVSSFYHFPTGTGSHLRLNLLLHIPLLHLSTKTQLPKDAPFMAQYLISSFGFPPDRALKVAASSNLSSIRTSDRPDGVVHFLQDIGLSDSEIKVLVRWSPNLLSGNVDKTLRPQVRKLMAEGLTGDTLIQLIRLNPNALVSKLALPRVQFWNKFVGYRDADLSRVLRKNHNVLSLDIDRHVMPKLKILKEYGFSEKQVLKVLTSVSSFILRKPDSMKKLLEQTETLGFSRGSAMFITGLSVVGKIKFETIIRKLVYLIKHFGWSEKEAHNVFRKFPTLVGLSEQNLKCKMDFLLGKAGLENQDIFSNPAITGYSLQQRVIPRYHVLSILKSKGLSGATLCAAVWQSEENFLHKFVLPHKMQVPEIEDVYYAACKGKMPI